MILKGGGNAAAAARSVLEIGDVDYAWNVQVEPETLTRMQEAGLGTLAVAYTSLVERIVVNQTNPDGRSGGRPLRVSGRGEPSSLPELQAHTPGDVHGH